jgi:GT2 family glycosyltransferase
MRFSVCIPTVRSTTLEAAVRAVRGQTVDDWELIVIGQGDESVLRSAVDRAANGDARVRYVHLDVRGAARARNAGLGAARGELIAFTDDDCEVQAGWLAALDHYFASDPDVGMVVGPLVRPPRARRTVPAVCPEFVVPAEVTYRPGRDTEAPPGFGFMSANFAIARDVAARVGRFDEALGAGTEFAAAEDTDFMLRLERMGVTMIVTPKAVVHHTSGFRYGWRAFYRHKRNYARGNGALAAKLSLLGDPRGREWLSGTRSEVGVERLRSRQLDRIPAGLFRYYHYRRAYDQCLRRYAGTLGPGDDPTTAVLAG